MAKKGKFTKQCPVCNAEQVYGRYDHYQSAIKGNWKCKKCGTPKNTGHGRYEDILYSWFDVKRRGARDRGLTWDLTIEGLWNLYITQNKKCALSGVDIGWAKTGLTATASIDRIDSNGIYEYNNIQWVHKDVNLMKNHLNQEYFVQMCKLVSSNAGGACEIK